MPEWNAPTATTAAPLPPPDEPAPTVRLPNDVRPLAQKLELSINPDEDRFQGSTEIDVELDHARRTLWIHGHRLTVDAATFTPDGGPAIAATGEQVDDHGVAKLTLSQRGGSGAR